jgi:hypothetical protein
MVLVIGIMGPGIAKANPGWYDSGWTYRKKITLNAANVTANLSDFPALISITDSDLASHARSDGWDILFTAGDETTRLQHEIESYNATTQNLVAWVKIPSLSSSANTDIYMYYGNSGVTGSSANATGVWDTNFKMVQHMEEASGGTNKITDSTSNSNNGTDYNSPVLGASGKIGKAITFDGTNDYIQVADSNSLDIASSITLEAWINPSLLDTNHRRIMIKQHSAWLEPYYMYSLWVYKEGTDPNNNLGLGISNGAARAYSWNGTLATSAWQYVTGTFNGTQLKWYINGTLVTTKNTAPVATIGTNNQPLIIGDAPGGANLKFAGGIDEIRISSTARSADWIKTSYNNQSNPAAFLALGTEETEILAPSVATGPATSVEETSATINGTLTDDGGEACEYRFEYDFDAPGEPYAYSTSWEGSINSGQPFSAALSSLSKGTKYYFRAQARNSTGTASGSGGDFLTKPDPPTSFTAMTASSSQINLSWTKGEGAQRTLIMRKEGSYPAIITDGDQVYFYTGESTPDTGLMPGVTYFYSAWSEVTGSTQYSDTPAQANATTTSGAPTVIGGAWSCRSTRPPCWRRGLPWAWYCPWPLSAPFYTSGTSTATHKAAANISAANRPFPGRKRRPRARPQSAVREEPSP